MKFKVIALKTFQRYAKKLSKHYASFGEDLTGLIEQLGENPYQGADLGGGVRKVRMQIRSKRKGKSGGARVIVFTTEMLIKEIDGLVVLMTIYDKSERDAIHLSEIDTLIKEMKQYLIDKKLISDEQRNELE